MRGEPDKTPVESARKDFLDRNAEAIGLRWAVAIRANIVKQHRAIAGGFPGTLSEIRRHVDDFLRPMLFDARMSSLTTSEREDSARRAYSVARTDWLAHRQPEPD